VGQEWKPTSQPLSVEQQRKELQKNMKLISLARVDSTDSLDDTMNMIRSTDSVGNPMLRSMDSADFEAANPPKRDDSVQLGYWKQYQGSTDGGPQEDTRVSTRVLLNSDDMEAYSRPGPQVRKTPSWPRSWANFSLF
jgi:hypothetical protein